MKSLKAGLLLFLSTILMVNSLACAQKSASLLIIKEKLSRKSMEVGDRLKYTISISTNKNIEIVPADLSKNPGDFIIKDYTVKQNEFFGRKNIIIRYLLTSYQTGKIVIPKIEIKYKAVNQKDWVSSFSSSPLIEVKSLLEKAGAKAALRDIKKPIELYPKKLILIILVILALLIAAVFVLKFYLEQKAVDTLKRMPSADEIAYEQLEKLKNKDLIRQGKIQEYFVEISGIIRHYLENRFNFKAPEMTTEEFLAYARDNSAFISEHKALLREFLVCCDMVKFAKYAPLPEEILAVFYSAKKFIDQTKNELS